MLFNVWVIWCLICCVEYEYLNKLVVQGICVVGLNYKDDCVKVVQWFNLLGNFYVLSLYDGDGMLGLDLGVYGVLEIFLIDGQGIICYCYVGDFNDCVWQQEILLLYKKYQGGV